MYIKLLGLYHLDEKDPRNESYWQSLGDAAFQFTPNKNNATNLTQEQVDDILKYKRHYCRLYGASKMVVVDSL